MGAFAGRAATIRFQPIAGYPDIRAMNNPGRSKRISNQDRLSKLLRVEFHDAPRAADLFAEFLRQRTYDRNFSLKLIAVARERAGVPWEIRRLAVLMLEHQVLKLESDTLEEFQFLLTQLNLRLPATLGQTVHYAVLKEGYSTTQLDGFKNEFHRKLGRLNRVHEKIAGRQTSDAALRDFIAASRSPCKLSLARYLFTPAEIVDEILRQSRVSEGVRDPDTTNIPFVGNEARRAISLLPDFEAEILKRLCQDSRVYWVSETSNSEINSLVEYPLTTVVLVVKPPGSNLEFEIKRVGRRGRNPLSAVYARNGYTVAPSHRLDGGNMQWLLQYEAISASKLSLIYRLVHEIEAPIASYISRSSIFSVPVRDEEVQTLPYFTDPQLFGKGFREMRAAMKDSIAAFKAEGNDLLPQMPGDLGLTAQFIGHVSPAQAILSGTSSFRLDKVATYLSHRGPEIYFKQGLGVNYLKRDERRFADELLEEILGVYHPPRQRYQSYEKYLAAAFSVAENRDRADHVYLSLVQQIGRFWGTLIASRSYTRGESFVARNVGLRSVWEKGQWQVKLIFMDHDAVVMPGPEDEDFEARSIIPGMNLDETYIWGRSTPERFATSEVGYLQRIYRIGEDLDAKGESLARLALKAAYQKTQKSLLTNPRLRALFNVEFIARLPVWDSIVGAYLQLNGEKSAPAKWKKKLRKLPAATQYRPTLFEGYLDTIEKHKAFLERYRELFDVDDRAESN